MQSRDNTAGECVRSSHVVGIIFLKLSLPFPILFLFSTIITRALLSYFRFFLSRPSLLYRFSEALKLAMQHDPEGRRTLGVVTKADMVSEDCDILSKMRMERPSDVKLALGFIAVRNRTPSEVRSNIPQEEAMRKERELFASHALLQRLEPDLWGIHTLTDRIVYIQAERVSECIPKLREYLHEQLALAEAELAKLKPVCASQADRRAALQRILSDLAEEVRLLLAGLSGADRPLQVPPRVFELAQAFSAALEPLGPRFLGEEWERQLEAQVLETRGVSLPNFMSMPLFTRTLQQVGHGRVCACTRVCLCVSV